MAILLDSALPTDARAAMELGFVRGITTNPALLARVDRPAVNVIRELCGICDGTVFYQLAGATVSERLEEGERMLSLNRELAHSAEDAHLPHTYRKGEEVEGTGTVGLKIPATTENMSLVAHFSACGAAVAVTAIFNAAQAYAACEAGATYLLPYVNRTARLRGDGIAFVAQLAQVCQAVERGTEVLAASIRTPREAVSALLAGARHVSMPLRVLIEMGHDPLSEEAIAEFGRAAPRAVSARGSGR